MKVIFEKQNSTKEFIDWLTAFKEIDDSLLIEVDLNKQSFIAKVTTEDQALVRYSQLPFEKAGFTNPNNFLDEDEKEVGLDTIGTERIKVGVFLTLEQLIKIAKTFETVDYKLIIEFDENLSNKGKSEWHAQSISFESYTLNMSMACSNVSEFVEITDDVFFNRIYKLENTPCHARVTLDNVKMLLNVAAIQSVNGNKDVMTFYVTYDETAQKYALRVKDGLRAKSYDQLIGFVDEDKVEGDISLSAFRQKFIMATKGLNSNLIFSVAEESSRIFIDTEDEEYKTVVAIVRD